MGLKEGLTQVLVVISGLFSGYGSFGWFLTYPDREGLSQSSLMKDWEFNIY